MPEREHKTNWRLMRVAEGICLSTLTDGFCHPKHKPDCRCWSAARGAVQGLGIQANAALADAWPNESEEARRARLEALCRSITDRSDELTQEHFDMREAAR